MWNNICSELDNKNNWIVNCLIHGYRVVFVYAVNYKATIQEYTIDLER